MVIKLTFQIYLAEPTDRDVKVADARCSCTIGLSGCCGHIAGILYTLADYKVSMGESDWVNWFNSFFCTL